MENRSGVLPAVLVQGAAHPLSDLASAIFLDASLLSRFVLLSSSPLLSNVPKYLFNYELHLVTYIEFKPSDLKIFSLGQQPGHPLIFDLTRVEIEVRNWRIRPFFKGVLIIIFAFETSRF